MATKAIRVFIVDDLPVTRIGLRTMLDAPDIKVVGEAPTLRTAVTRARRRHPDVALVGLSVCGGRDLSLVETAKAQWPKTSILILGRSMSTAEVRRALALGCSGYLPLSVEREQFLHSVRAVARGECIVDPDLLRQVVHQESTHPVSVPGAARQALTAPERDLLRLIAEGLTNRQIAQRLRYSVGTVKDYVQRIIQKLDVSDRTQAAVKAVRLRLLD